MATIIDVAKLAGVSKSTVSRYINGETVKEKTRIAIERSIKELDYHINPIARSLKTKRTYAVGILIPNLVDLFCTSIVRSCEAYLNRFGYSVILCDTREDIETEEERLNFLQRRKVDGIILDPCSKEAAHILKSLEPGMPLVLIDRFLSEIECDSVLVDNFDAVYKGIVEMIKRGHRRIGFVCGPIDRFYTAEQRFLGYQKALADYDIPYRETLVRFGNFGKESGKKHFLELLNLREAMRPTAIFTSNMYTSLGMVEAVLEHGIKIPEDVSVMAFDNLSMPSVFDYSSILKPRISTIKQPLQQIGEKAAELLLSRLEGDNELSHQVVHLVTELELTDSVGVVR
jgi:LacI family transcriptional regulator